MTPDQFHAVLCDHQTGAIHPVGGLEPDVAIASRTAGDAAASPWTPEHVTPAVVMFRHIPVPVALQYAGDGPAVDLQHMLPGLVGAGQMPDPEQALGAAGEGMDQNHVMALVMWMLGALGHHDAGEQEAEPAPEEMAPPANGNGAVDPRMLMDADQMLEAMAAQIAGQGQGVGG